MEKELKRVVDFHVHKYSDMTPQDLVKLIFQGEFGGGHLLTDYDRCLAWIEREYQNTAQQPDVELYEDIGFGFARLQLSALDRAGITPRQAANLFFTSASVLCGDQDRYLKKLGLLPSLIDDRFSFGTEEMTAFIADYLRAGGGMISHSEPYREKYRPAYRVIRVSNNKG